MDQSQSAKDRYKKMVEETSPDSKLITNCVKAFITGGAICVIGQILTNLYMSSGLTKDMSSALTSVTLILIAIILTGLGLYDNIGKFCGAGSVVPITGFANSVASPAIEYKREGYVLGVGAKMFLIAGPVIVFGTLTSVVVGLIYYFLK